MGRAPHGRLNALPQASVECLIKKVNALEEKYKDTYADVAERISEAERELDAMTRPACGRRVRHARHRGTA